MTDSTDKREKAMIAKYGSAEAVRQKRQEWAQKKWAKHHEEGKVHKGGYHYMDRKKVKEYAAEGAKKRWGK